MWAFVEVCPDEAIVQQLAAQILWFHSWVLQDRVKDADERRFYVRKTIEAQERGACREPQRVFCSQLPSSAKIASRAA